MSDQRHPTLPPPTPTPLCGSYAPLLAIYRLGELDADAERSLRQHLAGCAWCQDKLASLDILDAALRRHLDARGLLPPVPSMEEIMALSEQTPPTAADTPTPKPWPSGHPYRRVPALIAALAAVLIVALAASLFALHQRPTPRPTAHGTQRFPLPEMNSWPRHPVVGPDGNIWFVESPDKGVPKIGRISPGGSLTEFNMPATPPELQSGPISIVAGPDGNLWFTVSAGMIGRITPRGEITAYPIAASGPTIFLPGGIAVGPDRNLWFTVNVLALDTQAGTQRSFGAIGRITPQGGVTLFSLPAPWTKPGDIVADNDGQLWFDMGGNVGGISKWTLGSITTGGRVKMYGGSPSGLHLGSLALATDGSLWVAESNPQGTGGAVGHIDGAGHLTEYGLQATPVGRPPSVGVGPSSITSAPDGTLWITLGNGSGTNDALGHVTPGGIITETPLLPQTTPTGIVWGPDGDLWVTELTANAIERIVPPK